MKINQQERPDDHYPLALAQIPGKFQGIAPTVVNAIDDDWTATWTDGQDTFTINNLSMEDAFTLAQLPRRRR